MKTLPDIIEVLNRLPNPNVGSMTDKLRGGNPAVTDMADDVNASIKPLAILEIGTHCGGSGLVWLGRTNAHLTTIDLDGPWVSAAALDQVAAVLKEGFPGRVDFIRGDSTSPEVEERLKEYTFDLAFIDGNHAYDWVKKDIALALRLGIDNILLDDYTTCEDVRRAAAEAGLIHVKTYPAVHNPADIGLALFKRA